MFYLILQTSVLLSVCAAVFFGVGWLARRWMEQHDPWRVPARKPKHQDLSEVEALQGNLRQVSNELSQRNSELVLAENKIAEIEEKWKSADARVTELELKVEEHAQAVVEANAAASNAANAVQTDVGIAVALREQLRIAEEKNSELRGEISRFQSLYEEQQLRADALALETQALQERLLALEGKLSEQAILLTREKEKIESEMPAIEIEPLSLAEEDFAPMQPRLETKKPSDDSQKILERMDRLERQVLEKIEMVPLAPSSSPESEELKAKVISLEETILNLRAESEMAFMAQLEFQSRAAVFEDEEKKKWSDLEYELELRITQLEQELLSVRQAETVIGEISQQVEEKLKEQIQSLSSEVVAIKNSWNSQEVEFKVRDGEILGNLDRLHESLNKLGVRIDEDQASLPDSILVEMEELKGDILTSVPVATLPEAVAPAAVSSKAVSEISKIRDRFEKATDGLQHMLEEKDKTIRALDEKIQSMAKKLDPSLVGQDDLSLIKGIGPYIKKILQKDFEIYTFKQVASLSEGEIQKISERLFFKNKIEKEDWIGQARSLHQKKYDEWI